MVPARPGGDRQLWTDTPWGLGTIRHVMSGVREGSPSSPVVLREGVELLSQAIDAAGKDGTYQARLAAQLLPFLLLADCPP
jgi:hypothetical protein